MGQRFVLIHERSIKELIRAADSSPSWHFLKTIRFGDANRRGSLPGLGGWWVDVFMVIQGASLGRRLGAKPHVLLHAIGMLGEAKRVSQSPHQMQFGIVGYTKTLDSLFQCVMMVPKEVLFLKTIVREKHE
mgnify:CR=1 FL=1